MHPPTPFKYKDKISFSLCIACDKWTYSNNYFHHEGRNWILCDDDYADYWENTDELQSDYRSYG